MPDSHSVSISVVTPTRLRAGLVRELLGNLEAQTLPPREMIIIDGSPDHDQSTSEAVAGRRATSFDVVYARDSGGTALQRNVGIERATGEFIAFIDDDIRLEPRFFETIVGDFRDDRTKEIGGITGYITNQFVDPSHSAQWRWYRRLHAFSTYEPGSFDWSTGNPINRYIQPPHSSLRPVDVMGAGCAVWRREVFDGGLRFDDFFSGYGMLEDAHLALRARRRWELREDGRARCEHLRAQEGRPDLRLLAQLSAVNYRFVFVDVVQNRTLRQEARFWWVQVIDLLRLMSRAARGPTRANLTAVAGKAQGMAAAFMRWPPWADGAKFRGR